MRCVERLGSTFEFTLTTNVAAEEVHVRMRHSRERWVAEVLSPLGSIGMGATARHALTSALEPLGEVRVRRLLADIGLLEPSVAVVRIEAADAQSA